MMQDTILTLCKESVKDTVKFMITNLPTDTEIFSTSSVKNHFEKKVLEEELV